MKWLARLVAAPCLGLALRARGHKVTLITNTLFEPLIRRVGLGFVELGTREHTRAIENPDLWHPVKGFFLLTHFVNLLVPELYATLARLYVPGETVVAAATLALGARVAQEKRGIRLATVHLQPSVLRSEYQAPVLPGLALPDWAPRWWKRFLYRLGDALVIDRFLAPGLNRFRSRLGLRPVRRVLHEWWHSPRRVIGLFPEWYAPPQPDWPPALRLTGFALYDERGLVPAPPEAEDFLARGEPPVVFTPGSAMKHGRPFFEAAAEACRLLGRRGLFLTRYPEQLPAGLPETVRHFDFIPFSQVLPRAAALVHHGGIGTCAQGLAAGVPQLVMPMGFDQFDNAARLARLGVGRSLRPAAFRGPAVAAALRSLLTSPQVAEACRSIAARFPGTRPLERACDLIEELQGGEQAPAPRPATGKVYA